MALVSVTLDISVKTAHLVVRMVCLDVTAALPVITVGKRQDVVMLKESVNVKLAIMVSFVTVLAQMDSGVPIALTSVLVDIMGRATQLQGPAFVPLVSQDHIARTIVRRENMATCASMIVLWSV